MKNVLEKNVERSFSLVDIFMIYLDNASYYKQHYMVEDQLYDEVPPLDQVYFIAFVSRETNT